MQKSKSNVKKKTSYCSTPHLLWPFPYKPGPFHRSLLYFSGNMPGFGSIKLKKKKIEKNFYKVVSQLKIILDSINDF